MPMGLNISPSIWQSSICYRKCTISKATWKTKINSICKQKATRSGKKLLQCRTRAMWLSNKYSQFFSLTEESIDFDVILDHVALTHIIKSKAEPATTRIKRLLELISSYSFNLYYIKGKDMVLSDFLSRQSHDNSNPHEVIPISFNMHNLLHNKYYDIGYSEWYLVQMQSPKKSNGIKLPEVHGVRV